jgi:putative membrane protein
MLESKWMPGRRTPRTWKGALAGLVGGLAASWVMNQFQAAVPADTFKELLGEANDGGDDSGSEEAEPATVEAAEAVSEHAFDHELTDDEKSWAGPAVHYTHGSLSAALYGALVEHEPAASAGAGLPFGIALWLVAEEGTVPVLGLSQPPWTFPPSTHAYSLASHLVYGLSTEVVRRLVRRVL